MPTIKDCLGRDVVVYNHSESFDAFRSAIIKAVCKACDIPEKMLEDVKWANPHYFGFISPVEEEDDDFIEDHSSFKNRLMAKLKNKLPLDIIDSIVTDINGVQYKFVENATAKSTDSCQDCCDIYLVQDCRFVFNKSNMSANYLCEIGGYFKEV